MPFVNFNVDSYPCGSRSTKERGKHAHFRPVFILGVYSISSLVYVTSESREIERWNLSIQFEL